MFKHIRNINYFIENLSDWSIFDNAMSKPNKRPMDIDGLYESKGHTLFLEEKIHGVSIPTGQNITFDDYHLAPDKSVMVLWYIKTYCYDFAGDAIIDQHGLHEYTKEYTKFAVYVQGQDVYERMLDNTDKPRTFVKNWEMWTINNPYLTKEQMIARVTNGITNEDAKQLFDGIRLASEFED